MGPLMTNIIRHFAVHADDVGRAAKFYEAVFGWTFEAWGPPNFFLIHGAGLQGALQKRAEPVSEGGLRGFEMTVGVDDVDATGEAAEAAGGKITMARIRIQGVGDLIWIEDTEGNRVGAMEYDAATGSQ